MSKKILMLVLLWGSVLNALNLNINKEVFAENENIIISFEEVSNQNKDWIGIYPAGSNNDWNNVLLWKWTNDIESDSLTFNSLPIGKYEARLFYNNSFTSEISKKFKVKAGVLLTSVTTNKKTYVRGESISSTFKNMSGNKKDWIAIYPKNSTNEWKNVLQWKWIDGARNGVRTFKPLALGDYEVRVFFNNTYNIEAKYAFSVINKDIQTTVNTNKESYTSSQKIEINFKNMSGSSKDWMAIYPKGSNNEWKNVLRWKWIKGLKKGTKVFKALPEGTYEVRVFFNNTYHVEASHTFTVADSLANVNRKDFQLFGDPELNRIVGMQMSTMKQVFDFTLDGENIYSSDIINDKKSYAYGRETNKIFILKKNKKGIFSERGTIPLTFAPRTGAKNRKLGLTLITGSEKPMYAIINTKNDKVVATGGRNEVTRSDDKNHGSKWATGHGVWLTDNHFVVPDREARDLILYEINSNNFKVKELNRIRTSSSIHTVIGKLNNTTGIYYAVTEGSDSSAPSLIELKFNGSFIQAKRIAKMPGNNLEDMTSHHAKPLPDGIHIYMGTSDGVLHIINKKKMKVVKSIQAGKGAGHTTLIAKHNLAVVTNHKDTFVTVINTLTHTKIKDVTVSGESIKGTALQSHTARVSPNSKYYYNFATDNGYYYRINLLKLVMDKKTYTGGTPKQASQPGEVN